MNVARPWASDPDASLESGIRQSWSEMSPDERRSNQTILVKQLKGEGFLRYLSSPARTEKIVGVM